jgi:hypothetical protein
MFPTDPNVTTSGWDKYTTLSILGIGFATFLNNIIVGWIYTRQDLLAELVLIAAK